MSIFDLGGVPLSLSFGVDGMQLMAAYSLSGDQIWTANETRFEHGKWKFKKISNVANTSYTSTAETAEDFDDSSWEEIQIPHDWSIRNNFNSASKATYEGGYLDGGDAWYRTTFYATEELLSSDRLYLYFDGVYMESTVYVNGVQVEKNYHGYNPFWADISKQVHSGKNTIAVFVRNRQPSSRWYSGSGIYRSVYLCAMEQADISVENIAITYPNLETQKDSSVDTVVDFSVHNFGTASINRTVKVNISKDNAVVATKSVPCSLTAGENNLSITVPVVHPELWNIGASKMYSVTVEVSGGTKTYQSHAVAYGYRYFRWDVDTGFWLNGARTKIQGVCMHHDLGCIGAEANRSAMERQIDILIAMGCNAIRLTHNPASTMFLDLCAKKGVMCVEELFDMWTVGKNNYDFHLYYSEQYETVIRNTLLRDRNNPAIIMWSLGNEINRTAKYTADQVRPIITALITAVKKYDTTRPCTMGEDRPDMEAAKVCMELLDVCGINYTKDNLSIPHNMGKPSYGSETTSALSSRGVYARDNTGLQCSSYDDDVVSWGSLASAALKAHAESAYSGGHFVWTGFDYIGEPTPFNKYPAKSSYFGIVDLAGFPKDIYYMYQSRWTTSPMIHIVPMNWDNWTEGETVPVWIYSNCASVELFQDGVSLGKKTQAEIGDKYQFSYSVVFSKGNLVARGYNSSGSVIATDTVRSSNGIPAKLVLTAYKNSVDATTDDLVFVTCEVQDENGVLVPDASNKVTFSVSGGTVLGTDNGNAACVEAMRSPTKSAFNGKVLCVCQHDKSTGNIIITATASGLASGSVVVQKK